MSLLAPKPVPYDAIAWSKLPLRERGRIVCAAWALDGYGTPIAALALHGFLTSNVPMGVPLEWNVVAVYTVFALLRAHPDIAFWDIGQPAVAVGLAIETQPHGRKTMAYRIVDAATGLVERGALDVGAMRARQPWHYEAEASAA